MMIIRTCLSLAYIDGLIIDRAKRKNRLVKPPSYVSCGEKNYIKYSNPSPDMHGGSNFVPYNIVSDVCIQSAKLRLRAKQTTQYS